MAQTADALAGMGALKDMMLKMRGQQGGQRRAGDMDAQLQARAHMEAQQQGIAAQQQAAAPGMAPQLAQLAPSLMSQAQPEMDYQQMAMQNKAAQQASLPQRAPLLQRDMMRKQMVGMMGPQAQPQPPGARAQLMNAKRGMMQGGRGGRGAIQTALNSQSQRQMQRPQ